MTALRPYNPCSQLAAIAVAALIGSSVGAVFAQTTTGVPNALQGFSQNRDKPVQIDAATLEVRDRDKTAMFSGKVRVVQGDTTLRSNSLLVFYDQGGEGAKVIQAGSKQQIRRLEAKGNVVVTQKEQTATGETAIYDLPSDTVTLQGDLYKGAIGESVSVAMEPTTRPAIVQQDGQLSGGNLLGRWGHVLKDGSDLQLQTYYDRTSRH